MDSGTTELDFNTLKKILDNSHDEIYVTNAMGIVIYVNNVCEKHYGVKASEIIGKKSREISEKKYWGPRVSPIAIDKKMSITLEQKTCTGKTLLTTATPVFDSEGNIELIIENSRDVTESEGMKHELDKSIELLKRYKMEVEVLRKKEMNIPDFICQSPKMESLLKLVRRISAVNSTVLLLGESGSGKGHMAKYIHNQSPYKDGPFITVNCASIPSELMEAEMFGYSKGAFTGANVKGNIGLIELANDGTLFLDEIAELSPRMQAKLLQVLHENQYFKVGGREIQQVQCRVIAATNRNLQEMIKKGTFREDLYYRLNIFELTLPPLRDRREEIIPLSQFILAKFNKKYKLEHEFSSKCYELFKQYPWPGNVRELENIIERLTVVTQDKVIDECDLPQSFQTMAEPQAETFPQKPRQPLSLDDAICNVEKNLIIQAYKNFGSSYEVAKVLDISQSKANRLIRKYCPSAHSELN
ncbi:sigma-54 interaction domain-containing protein [Desulfosporosinus nitroreducens]|uniref:Sigma 54-interacting transcriptional regulator n=1 Tax=Desulfosporosinus nitroreducens TaxID=2018668 RepID=A0ABT8R034_9FIRM|nr:sigma 54-interacting transcriptional regulator [Desulfosporosinus nitroreducens]MCO1604296.1 sigma 54-interacting transcriptional regulator [Desulfosporosinus nitroreducens]MDO0825633.1 sigma 54-interacting transcriptional regulator [Desulfosporosinus nitroreducens]